MPFYGTGGVGSNGGASVDASYILDNSIVNDDINLAAAIAYSKLNLAGSIVNADINPAAAIAYSKLLLTGSILNADVNAAAAIAYTKLALTNSIVNADISASAAIVYSKLSLANSLVNADVAAGAAIAYTKLSLANSIVNADISPSAAIAESKLALASDAAAATPSRRTIGTGALQAKAGNAPEGHVIEDEGTPLTTRTNMNFTGSGVTVADSGGKTVVTVAAAPGTSAHDIAEEGSTLTARSVLNFTGSGVTATDNAGAGRTDVTIPGDRVMSESHTFAWAGAVAAESGTSNYFPPMRQSELANETVLLTRIRYSISSGTSATFSLKQNGSDVTGYTGIVATTTDSETNAADVAVANNDLFRPVVTAVSGSPFNLSITLFFQRTVSA